MIEGYQIESVAARSGRVYVLGFLPANADIDAYRESMQAALDPTGKRKTIRIVPIDTGRDLRDRR